MTGDPYDYEDDYFDGELCPRCDGHKWVSCHCGGDLCFCENHGERECPLCHGEGEVEKAAYEKFVAREREVHAAFRAAVAKVSTK